MSAVRTLEPISESAVTQHSIAIHAQEIGKDAWPEFCRWMTATLAGVTTNIVRDEGNDRAMVECLDRELKSIDHILLPSGVNAIHVTVDIGGKPHRFEVAGPCWLRVHYDAAGFVIRVEIGYEEGKLILSFTGSPAPGTIFTANSWGE